MLLGSEKPDPYTFNTIVSSAVATASSSMLARMP